MAGSAQHEWYDGAEEAPLLSEVLSHRVASALPRRRDLVCAGCGYGVVVTDEPERCPLCGGSDWDFAPWRPFSGGATTT